MSRPLDLLLKDHYVLVNLYLFAYSQVVGDHLFTSLSLSEGEFAVDSSVDTRPGILAGDVPAQQDSADRHNQRKATADFNSKETKDVAEPATGMPSSFI